MPKNARPRTSRQAVLLMASRPESFSILGCFGHRIGSPCSMIIFDGSDPERDARTFSPKMSSSNPKYDWISSEARNIESESQLPPQMK
jgi:hypothetical protein